MDSTRPPPPFLPPVFTRPRRVIIACTNCRKRKIRCLTLEDTPVNPCDRCSKKGLKCEYVTITNQREDSESTNPPLERGPSHSSSNPPPSRSQQASSGNSSRPVDPRWDRNSRRDPAAQPRFHQPVHGSQYLPYQAGYPVQEYARAYQTPSFPGATQPRPYLDPVRNFAPATQHNNHVRPPVADGQTYGANQWARCGICPLGFCRCRERESNP
ncbi:hypothetical protein B0H14DRAFT_2577755 [Mycena olivaceomarginata]|nr:hypothetical protein B0H14DRAFT_2577755 [Mycena olivaceomarginata]